MTKNKSRKEFKADLKRNQEIFDMGVAHAHAQLSPPPQNLVNAILASLDKLGKMTIDQLHEQKDVGFLELLDMTFTLKEAYLNAILNSKPESISEQEYLIHQMILHPDTTIQHVKMLWEQYALYDDKKLTEGAKKLKYQLLDAFKK